MSRFNTTLPKQKTLTNNLAGGQAGIYFTSFNIFC